MTTLDIHVGARAPRSTPAAAGPFGWLRRWSAERRIRAELSALSDRELDDIGLVRRDVPRVARAAAAGI